MKRVRFDGLIELTARERKFHCEISVGKCCTTSPRRANGEGRNFFPRNVKRVPVIFGVTEFCCNNFAEKLSAVRLALTRTRHISLSLARSLSDSLFSSLFYVRTSFRIRTVLYPLTCFVPFSFSFLFFWLYSRPRSYVARVFFPFCRRNSIAPLKLHRDPAIPYTFQPLVGSIPPFRCEYEGFFFVDTFTVSSVIFIVPIVRTHARVRTHTL